MTTVLEAPPIVLDNLLDPDQLAGIEQRCDFARHLEPADYTSFDDRTEFAPVPADLMYVVAGIADAASTAFNLPVSRVQATMLRYHPGVGHDWHTDGNDLYDVGRDRTVSFSLLLNQHGVDYTGGQFQVDHNGEQWQAELNAGDAVIFTAATRHRVRPVTSGRRLVIVCFASA